jgi:hypothetical protein
MWHVAFKVREKDLGVSPVISEFLRYSGVISTSLGGHTAYLPNDIDHEINLNPGEVIIVINQPKDIIKGQIWAERNKDRIESFGGTKAYIFKG